MLIWAPKKPPYDQNQLNLVAYGFQGEFFCLNMYCAGVLNIN